MHSIFAAACLLVSLGWFYNQDQNQTFTNKFPVQAIPVAQHVKNLRDEMSGSREYAKRNPLVAPCVVDGVSTVLVGNGNPHIDGEFLSVTL